MADLITENRQGPRRRAPQRGRVVSDGGVSIPCTIRDFSPAGARLSVERAAEVPDRFMLIFEEGLGRKRCVVRWRNEDVVGVEFP